MVRNAAVLALEKINKEAAYANLVVQDVIETERFDDRDRRFFTSLVYGVLRHQNHLVAIIETLTGRPVNKLKPRVREILKVAIYQILFLDRVPDHSAVNEAVKSAKKKAPALGSFVNAVLRNVIRQKDKLTVESLATSREDLLRLKYNFPLWLLNLWDKEYGHEMTEKLCQSFNEVGRLTARVNTLRIDRESLVEEMTTGGWTVRVSEKLPEAILIDSHDGSLQQSAWYKRGYIHFMNESSMAVAHVMNPKAKERILDLCAAPGGKSLHMATMMGNSGDIVSGDIHEHKLALIEKTAERLGVKIIETRLGDGCTISPKIEGLFDGILVDAPCSGLGVLRKKLDMRWRKEETDLAKFPPLQLALLEAAAQCLKKGGRIVYSTCTLNKKENESVVKAFLAKHDDFILADASTFLPFAAKGPMVTLLPFDGQMDGFFIARLERRP